MQKKIEAPSDGQLRLEFDADNSQREESSLSVNNVVKVDFGVPKSSSLPSGREDQALIKQILQNAQKLSW